MSVREGYKQTEIGVLPEEWEAVSLGDIGTLSKGKGIAKSEITESGFPCVRYGEIYTKHDFVIKKFHSFINDISAENSRKISNNEVLFAGSGETVEDIGKAVVYLGEHEAYAGGDIVILTPKNSCGLFLSYVVNSFEPTVKQRRKQGQGNAVVHIYAKGLATVQIPLPPLQEQQKIAEILSTVDQKIDSIDFKIEETQTLKRGLMQRLLSEGIGHSKFKESEIGRIPITWEIKNIEDIAEVKGGKRLPKGYDLTDIVTPFPYIRVTNMSMGGINNKQMLYVPIEIQPKIKNYTISKEDLFIAVAGNTLGMVGDIPEFLHNANLTENADKICNIKINKNYLLHVLMSNLIQNEIKNTITTNAQPKLALTRIKTFKLPIPSKEEQQSIAEILSTTDEKLESLRAKKEAFETLKKGLMQKLLSGEVRVSA